MILVELTGGIGNQMFQYAAAKSLALHHREDLKLVLNFGNSKHMPEGLLQRQFDLHQFKITDDFATAEEVSTFTFMSTFEKLREKGRANHKRKIYREPFFHFDQNFYKAQPNVFLKGLWQSEKYFHQFERDISQLFKFKESLTQPFRDLADKIRAQESVALHIRRGDYLTKIALQVLRLMPVEYYKKGVEYLASKRSNLIFYIFSDDINWAKENLEIGNAFFVSDNISKNHYEDLYLMSQCKHNIIANSTFSWWGAWLNDNFEKIVIAPKQWFNKGPKDTQDLIPETWIKL